MIKIVLASIDALVEKEVIPEVSEDLSCTKGACDLASALFLSPAALSVNATNRSMRLKRTSASQSHSSSSPPAVTSHA